MGQRVKNLTVIDVSRPTRIPMRAADEAQHNGLDEKLPEDVMASCADGHAKPDFAGSLGHGDQHDVHDSHPADDQRDQGHRQQQIAHRQR